MASRDADVEKLYAKIDELERSLNKYVKRVEDLEKYRKELDKDVAAFGKALEDILKKLVGFFGGIE